MVNQPFAIQCRNNFGMAMSFVGKPSDKMLAFLIEQANEIRNYALPPPASVARLGRIRALRSIGKSLKEIGKSENISKQRVSQILKGESK
jgi:hypothetical protein